MKQFNSHFELHKRTFAYFNHPYNMTRVNERAVEVPVGLHLLTQSGRTLEVGAVLPHYKQPMQHTCIDLTESFPRVINADVLTYEPLGRYDLVVSISTLDHLKSREEVVEAVTRMLSWLTDTGIMFVTLPYGQPSSIGGGPWLDELVLDGILKQDLTLRMDKVAPRLNEWAEVDLLRDPFLKYNGRSPFANTVFMLFWGDLTTWW